MTKLNYARPDFRYFDSLRRELRRRDRASLEQESAVPSTDIVIPEDAFPLTAEEAAVVLRLFDAIETHFLVESDVFQTRITRHGLPAWKPLTPTQETALRGAEQKMRLAADAIAQRMLQSGLEGRLHLVVLFTDMRQRLPPVLWDLINNDLLKFAFTRLEGTVRLPR